MGCGENHHINAKFKWQLVKTITKMLYRNLLAITSTYHIFNPLNRPIHVICQFWGTTTLFSHQKVRKFATKQPKLAKIVKSYTSTAGGGGGDKYEQ